MHHVIIAGIGDDADIGMVLGRSADHGRAADVDILDDVGIVGAGMREPLRRDRD